MWLAGPVGATLQDHRRLPSGQWGSDPQGVPRVCRAELGQWGLFGDAVVAIDGSKFKAVNNRDKNFTPHKLQARMQQLEEEHCALSDELIGAMEPVSVPAARVSHLKEKIATVKSQARRLRGIAKQLQDAPDQQVSLTDPHARSMATSGRGTGIVGYNVQAAVDTTHHMIVAHEVTNLGHYRSQLTAMSTLARDAIGGESLTVLADRGDFDGEEVLKCAAVGITPLVPKPITSNSRADATSSTSAISLDNAKRDEYRCPAGEPAIPRIDHLCRRPKDASVLAFGLPALPDQIAMYTQRLPPHRPLGTLTGAR